MFRFTRIACSFFLLSCCLTALQGRVFGADPQLEKATFGGGCYWCVEAIFQRIEGVENVRPGFMGGRMKDPTYEQVLTGRSGHVEVVQMEFDPSVVDYETLLQIFWRTHDPTTRNRQGPDVGPQYRSVVFFHSKQQRETADEYKRLLSRQKTFRSPIVTTIESASDFYPTKRDHLNYFNLNSEQQYCQVYIVPKLKKLQTMFGDKLRDTSDKK